MKSLLIELGSIAALIAVISGCAWGWSIALEEMETTPDRPRPTLERN